MPKMKSKRIAVPTELLLKTGETMSLRSIKALLFPFTQIYWGKQYLTDYTDRKTSKIFIDIQDFAEVMGYAMSSRITTEIRKIYRQMNIDLFGEENSPDRLFSYEGTNKDKTQFILKVHSPCKMYNITENCSAYTRIDAEDLLRCETIYDYRVLFYILLTETDKRHTFYQLNWRTMYLKYWVFGMDMLENCYIDKKSRNYNKYMVEAVEGWYHQLESGEIDQDKFDELLTYYAETWGYRTKERIWKAFCDVVTFTKRTRLENYLQHGLEIINQGKMFHIMANEKTGKLFSKIKVNGNRVDHYEIKFWKNY